MIPYEAKMRSLAPRNFVVPNMHTDAHLHSLTHSTDLLKCQRNSILFIGEKILRVVTWNVADNDKMGGGMEVEAIKALLGLGPSNTRQVGIERELCRLFG